MSVWRSYRPPVPTKRWVGSLRQPTLTLQSLDVTSTFAPDLARIAQYTRALEVTSTFDPALTKASVYSVALAVTSTFTADLARRLTYVRTLAVTSTFAASLERTALYKVTLAVASTFAPAFQRKFFVTLAAGLVGSVALTKGLAVTLAVAGTWTAAVGVAYIARRTLDSVSTFTAGLSSVTIPGGGPGDPVSRWLRRLLHLRR